jgi:7,8-dihydropterin-6-yl-methyl-4-(beta-D-ribofuranosyl)aminobenzene 5'-phosphate synthase
MDARPDAAAITILVDNRADQGLVSEHGFSAWIEVAGRRLLFDTGQGPALPGNADRLNVDLREADILVLGHGHYDHTGGKPLVVERGSAVQVYLHPAATGPRYSIREGAARSIAMPEAAKAALYSIPGARAHWITRALEVAAGVGLAGPIPRLTDCEDVGGPFFVDPEATHADPILDDQALWIRTDAGLVVIVGCGYAGLINTLRHVTRLSGEPRDHAVMGGFHLASASSSRIEGTIAELRALNPDLIVPCHCTGGAAVERLKQTFGERVVPGSAGASQTFGIALESTSGREA